MKTARSRSLLAIFLLSAIAGGCVSRPVVSPPPNTPPQPVIGAHAAKARSLTWMDYRHSANQSLMGLKVSDGSTEYKAVFTGTSLQLGVAADWYLPEGNAYITGQFPRSNERLWWSLLITNHISIGVDGTTVLIENPPQPDKPRVERVYLIDAPVPKQHLVRIQDIDSNVRKALLDVNGYIEFKIDAAGNRTFEGPFPLPTDPNDPKFKFIESMKQSATTLNLRT